MNMDERLEALTHSLELMAGMQVHVTERQDIALSKLQESHENTERTLRRAIRLSVKDGLRQRKRNQEFDEKMTQLASAQLQNEELLKKFLDRGGNGKH